MRFSSTNASLYPSSMNTVVMQPCRRNQSNLDLSVVTHCAVIESEDAKTSPTARNSTLLAGKGHNNVYMQLTISSLSSLYN